jgi:magnesium chelatase family protein
MLSRALSAYAIGIDAHLIEVEVDIAARSLPHFSTVGLPDAAVKESRGRIKAALKNIGFNFPLKKITISLPQTSRKRAPRSTFPWPLAS